MRQCPNGHEVNDNANFCPICGVEIIGESVEEIRFCKNCGHERNEDEKFCPQCGSSYYGKEKLPINDNTNLTRNRNLSAKIWLLVLVLCLLLAGGYFVYYQIENKQKEDMRLQLLRIEAQNNEKIRQEERKRIEEENLPAKRLYKIASQGSNVFWGATFSKKYIPSTTSEDKKDLYTIGFFIRPTSDNSGELSYVVLQELNFDNVIWAKNLYAVYTITDDVLQATLEGNYTGTFLNKGETISLKIENDGDNVRLVGISHMNNGIYKQMEPVTQKGVRFVDPKRGDLHTIIRKMFSN